MKTTFPFHIADAVGTITLTPENLHQPPTFDHESLAGFAEALDAVASREDEVRLLIIRSASSRFFCAGANIHALKEINSATIGDWVAHGHDLFNRLEDLPLPTVARVEGYALGGGLELALACDLIFAGEAAQLGLTEASLGFVTGWGGAARLSCRVGNARAKEMLFSARRVSGPEAATIGLVDFCGDTDALEVRCAEFTAAVKGGSARSHAEHKSLVRLARMRNRQERASAEAVASEACLASPETRKRLQDFLKSRKG